MAGTRQKQTLAPVQEPDLQQRQPATVNDP